jgi:enamine deaminase RidA (YjgF/YER057c/UK114 family)
MMRRSILAGVVLACSIATAANAQEIRREAAPNSPIANSVELPAGSRIVYVSGTVPDVADAAAPAGSPQRYGDTAAQTRSVLRTIEARLKAHNMGLGDVVMMRVFLVAPPGREAMDFGGMMTAYREFFGTAAQPNRPARSTMEVSGLVDPGWLVEIEVTAAQAPPRGQRRRR